MARQAGKGNPRVPVRLIRGDVHPRAGKRSQKIRELALGHDADFIVAGYAVTAGNRLSSLLAPGAHVFPEHSNRPSCYQPIIIFWSESLNNYAYLVPEWNKMSHKTFFLREYG
jgi:hypothetical protein